MSINRLALPIRSVDVDKAWPQVEPFIAEALNAGAYPYSSEDVRARCRKAEAQLWAGIADGVLEIVLVTEIIVRPAARIANVWLIAGKNARLWIEDRSAMIEEWARAEGCRRLTLEGREGWLRVLPEWRLDRVVMGKEL